MYLEAMERRGGIGTEYGENRLAMLRKKRDEMGQPYMTPHFEDEPNTLAHMRVQGRLEEQPPEMRYVAVNKNSGFPSPDFATQEELDAYIKTLPPNIQSSLVVKQAQVAKPPKKIHQHLCLWGHRWCGLHALKLLLHLLDDRQDALEYRLCIQVDVL